MAMQVAPTRSPALSLIAPFFLVAPLSLALAGLLLATTNDAVFVAINEPRTVAITHAAVIGWLTTAIMGAVYQLGPAVLGGRLVSERLARIQFVVHVIAVPLFVWSLAGWRLHWMGAAGSAVVLSFVLFLVNAFPAVWGARSGWTLPRAYLSVALIAVIGAAGLGITFVGDLEHLWFPITLGRLSGHAHLGLVGWLALAVMGTSYQLVPMFNLITRKGTRVGFPALAWTAGSAAIFAIAMMTDPAPVVRLVLALALAAGPAAWGLDVLRMLRSRARRQLDVQGHATFSSLAFLFGAIVVGLFAAIGTPFTTDGEPARWLLAYAALGIIGWFGLTLVGNSYKILSFLTWYHRYRPRIGRGPVPVIADIYNDRWAHAVLAAHGLAAVTIAAGALTGQLEVIRAGGAVLAVAGLLHALTLGHIVLAPHSPRVTETPFTRVPAQ